MPPQALPRTRRASTGPGIRSQLQEPTRVPLPASIEGPQEPGSSQVDTSNAPPEPAISEHLLATEASPGQHPRSCLPPKLPIGSPELLFLSELYPLRFSKRKRAILNDIFHTKVTYVPVCVNMATSLPGGIVYYLSKVVPCSRRGTSTLPLGPGRRGWPAGRVPVEVFNAITEHLPRESVQAMRLVNGEFEMKTSNRHFHTVVVPFRPEIYGMMTHQSEANGGQKTGPDVKGKGQAKLVESQQEEKMVHDGMKVFEAWGPHIKRFAMAFEVSEENLEKAPVKGRFEDHLTWWGSYRWPHPYYYRYEFCEGLERKADEFKCMSKALSYLQGTNELGLVLDGGLGWLNGPDTSDRAKLFKDQMPVFGKRTSQNDTETDEREGIWKALANSLGPDNIVPSFHANGDGFVEAQVRFFGERRHISLVSATDQSPNHRPLIFEGIDLATTASDSAPRGYSRSLGEVLEMFEDSDNVTPGRFVSGALKPRNLTTAQQEWLLETEWAQRAFLSSFCMALNDNSATFQHVHTLNIAKLSSRYLAALQREDFWRALPNLTTLTVHVSADWRTILKTDTGLVEAPSIHPSKAATPFYTLLSEHIAHIRRLRALNIGYVGGGEHQTGIFGRNQFVLPAPLMNFKSPATILGPLTDVLMLPHVERLTLTNCWMMPDLLKVFAIQLRQANLRCLNLISVSLTASPNDRSETGAALVNEAEGRWDKPQGPPRLSPRSVGDFFRHRHRKAPDTNPRGWVTKRQRVGSWGDVIDAITPGPTMDFVRYVFRYNDNPPAPRPTNLDRITFDSCGYVFLSNFRDFRQPPLNAYSTHLSATLVSRAFDLYPVMMTRPDDVLLGQIVTNMVRAEREVLTSAFPMRFGWPSEERERSLDNREDGQPLGGSGRFSGVIEKLNLPHPEL